MTRLLAKIGLVEIEGADVSLSPAGRKWFHPSSPHNLLSYLDRCRKLAVAYEQLDAVIAHDKPNKMMANETKDAFGINRAATQAFVMTMHASALEFVADLISEIGKLKSPTVPWRFLDVGCGRGTLSCALQDVFRTSRFRAFDLSGVSEWAESYAEEVGKERAVSIQAADWNRWPWQTESFDVVLLSQVLHEADEREAAQLFSNASSALAPDGLLVVVMVGDGTTASGDLLHSIFALNILVEIGGENPSIAWIEPKARQSGVETVCLTPLAGGRSLWIGRKIGPRKKGQKRRKPGTS
jgi:SAM-dependent methyltransferase